MSALRDAAAGLSGRRGRVLLDGAPDRDGLGGWSFAAADPVAELEVRGDQITLRGPGGEVKWRGGGDPLEVLQAMAIEYGAGRPASGPGPVAVGWIGYENRPPPPRSPAARGPDRRARSLVRLLAGTRTVAATPRPRTGSGRM